MGRLPLWAGLAGFALAASAGGALRAQVPFDDAARSLREQQARLGAGPGTVTLDRAARLDEAVTLGPGHGLVIGAPLSLGPGATVRLMGGNEVHCRAPLTADKGLNLFVAEGVTDVAVRDCDVAVLAAPGGALLTATRSQRVTATGNQLTDMAVFTTANSGGAGSQTTDVTLTGNSATFPKGGGPIGIYLMYVLRATVANNRFRGTGHGIEWWGGNADDGWRSAAAVTGAGEMSITGNECSGAGGACVWGSMGVDITVSGNVAFECGDVCFDTEGGVRNLFTGNVARRCGNGCFAAEFESEDATFSGNFAYADAKNPTLALVLIKHPSGRPFGHVRLSVTGNTLACGEVCAAFYSEGEDGLVFAGNTLTNGRVQFANYTNTVAIRGNTLRFTAPLGAQAAISGPTPSGGHRTEIADNWISNEAAGEASSGAGTTCISQGWSDFNSADEMRIVRNTCLGFPTGILTVTQGGNPGAPRAVWFLEGNQFSGTAEGQRLVHRRVSGNEEYMSVPATAAARP